jgi:hypothetical protein
MKILFKVQTSIGLLEILDNICWINSSQPTIISMTDEHIKNARLWLYGQIQKHEALGYTVPKVGGFDYNDWMIILKREEYRRQAVRDQELADRIKGLEMKAMSTVERKKEAKKLLASPTNENIAAAEKLLNV